MKINAWRLITISMFLLTCLAGPATAQTVTPAAEPAGWLDNLLAAALDAYAALPAPVQVVVVVLAMLVTLIPHLAPLTPWTWDDRTIQYKAPLTRFFLKLWNIAAGNWGRATNQPKGW